ncbi:copper-fist-domain-containing protein [Hymenopellis radicata]|nr:copper-fist-domain-containing protein [Hymenopellis radicata]
MVFVNNKKFACESCIKGHRSSSCAHTDRPLYEIKKKGRPISQCEKCRQLRQSRRVHSKCNCNAAEDAPPAASPIASGSKSKRFIPIVPALPNGLRDALQSTSSRPPDARQLVNSLLNPCSCKGGVGKCRCHRQDPTGLDALVQAVEMFEHQSDIPPPSYPPKARVIARPNSPQRKRRKTNPTSPQIQEAKSHTSTHSHSHTHSHAHHPHDESVELPPINVPEFQGVDFVPTFATMPSISEITSIAGSGCTCGVECGCPGCVEHRGVDHALPEHGACTDGSCRTCVDNHQGVELPTGLLHNFFALAAKLPEPPKRLGYPPVKLPKLCCGGKCGCPDGRCGCRGECGGCCGEHSEKEKEVEPVAAPSPPPPVEAPSVGKGCCCG